MQTRKLLITVCKSVRSLQIRYLSICKLEATYITLWYANKVGVPRRQASHADQSYMGDAAILAEQKRVSRDLPRPRAISPDLERSPPTSSDLLRSRAISRDLLRPRAISRDLPRSRAISPDLERSPPISSDLPRSRAISRDLPRSRSTSIDLPRPEFDLPRSPAISPIYPLITSLPRISHDLPRSPPDPHRPVLAGARAGRQPLLSAGRMLGSLQTALIRKHDVVSTLEFANYCIEFAN